MPLGAPAAPHLKKEKKLIFIRNGGVSGAYGVIPHETIPTTTSNGAAPWISGPPESPEQAETPPVNGPVQRLVSSTRSPFKFKAKMALRQESRVMTGLVVFCKMFGKVVPPVDPHPERIAGPTGIAWATGRRALRIRSV